MCSHAKRVNWEIYINFLKSKRKVEKCSDENGASSRWNERWGIVNWNIFILTYIYEIRLNQYLSEDVN